MRHCLIRQTPQKPSVPNEKRYKTDLLGSTGSTGFVLLPTGRLSNCSGKVRNEIVKEMRLKSMEKQKILIVDDS